MLDERCVVGELRSPARSIGAQQQVGGEPLRGLHRPQTGPFRRAQHHPVGVHGLDGVGQRQRGHHGRMTGPQRVDHPHDQPGGVSARAASCTSTNSGVCGSDTAASARLDRFGAIRPAGDDGRLGRRGSAWPDRCGRPAPPPRRGRRPRTPAGRLTARSTSVRPSSSKECLRNTGGQPLARPCGRDDRDCARSPRTLQRQEFKKRRPEPRRGWFPPWRRRCSRPAPTHRPGSGGPWPACASRRRTGRAPGRAATDRALPRRPC